MKKKRRLGYLSGAPRVSTHPEAESGGPRSHVLGVIQAFEDLNWQVKPFIVGDRMPWAWRGQGSEQLLSKGMWRRLGADGLRILMNKVNSQRAYYHLRCEVDWVYERFGIFQALGWPFKKRGVPWILESNGPVFHEAVSIRKGIYLRSLARHRELWAYRNCDVLVCTTEALRDILVSETDIDSEKVLIVPMGVDTRFYDAALYSSRRFFPGFTIGFVGSLFAWQGLDLLLIALAELKKKGITIYFVVVGDGPMRQTWTAQIRNYNLDNQVRFVGRVSRDEVPSYISGFDLGYSGQIALDIGKMYLSPLKLYEYMAMSKPVVASAHQDARSVIQEQKTGFLFEPGDKESLKYALLRAYNAQNQLADLGARARSTVTAEHSWGARVARMIGNIDHMLRNR